MSERQASTFRQLSYTRPQVLLMNRLNQEGIAYISEHSIEREGEINTGNQVKHWIIDIFIPPNLCVEVDGAVHFRSEKHRRRDEQKERWLDLHGYEVLRFGNYQVRHDTDKVIAQISAVLEKHRRQRDDYS